MDEAVGTYGRLDVFFANAGFGAPYAFGQTEAEEFMDTIRINTLR